MPGFDYEPGYTAFQFVFVLLQSAAFGGVFTGFGIARDFESRLRAAAAARGAEPERDRPRLRDRRRVRWVVTASSSPSPRSSRAWRSSAARSTSFGLYTLALLVNAAGVLWAAGVAMRFRTMQAGPVMQMPVFLILFFAPVYVPLDLLNGWIQTVATLNPLTYVLEAVRSMLAGDEVYVAAAFAIALALVGLLSTWALRGLRKAEAAG